METLEKTESASEQDHPMLSRPQAEHEWLQRMVGEWTFEHFATGDENCHSGTETVRSLGGLWVLAEGQGEMPGGGPAHTLMSLGYDPQKGRFVGTWIGSMMTHLWVYDGELDAEARVLTLSAEGPSMAGDGKMALYQDIITFESDDLRVLTSRMRGEDGEWQQFMTAHYRRTR